MSKLSGILDLDREILGKLNDTDLLKACSINKYTWTKVCDDAFLKRRLLAKYPGTEILNYKKETETWKRYFLKANHYIHLLDNYGYEYTFGDFVQQYILFEEYFMFADGIKKMLIKSAKYGELSVVIWCLENQDIKNKVKDTALIQACKMGHLNIVKYLIDYGISIDDIDVLSFPCKNEHCEVVKYLVKYMLEHEIDFDNKFVLEWVIFHGWLEVVKILLENNCILLHNIALKEASEHGQIEIVQYLVKQGKYEKETLNEALEVAIFKEHLEIVKYLLEYGAKN